MKSVMAAGQTPVGPLLQAFFIDYLYGQKRASARTVESYRDTFRLLLQFLRQTTDKEPSMLHTLDMDAPAILSFLDHLERQRNNQAQSRNVRTAGGGPLLFSDGGNQGSSQCWRCYTSVGHSGQTDR